MVQVKQSYATYNQKILNVIYLNFWNSENKITLWLRKFYWEKWVYCNSGHIMEECRVVYK